MSLPQNVLALLGRIFLSLIFLWSAFSKITGWEGTIKNMESHNVPATGLALVGAILLELVGAISVLLGFKTRLGALLLIAFLVPTTLIFHDFWDVAEAEQQNQQVMFMKNLAILGGLCFVMAFGAARYSIDARGQRSG